MTSLLAFVALLPPSPATLVFVRHGETVANATGKYNSKTLNVFSEKGQKQVQALTRTLLKEPKFDQILVSPSPRALRTIAPYLDATGQKAEIWPLLYECCTERPRQTEAKSFLYGAKITIPSDLDPSRFVIFSNDDHFPAPRNYGEGLVQVRVGVEIFQRRFGDRRILVVGHSAQGGLFIKGLTGKTVRVQNATPLTFTVRAKGKS
ncbi:hypothetical protein BH11ARM2_BH11ARM2_14340 [soil metagenome]